MKYVLCHNYIFILLFQMLATCFDLTRPSSGYYLLTSYIICTSILSVYKYRPDDGLVRPKLVANI